MSESGMAGRRLRALAPLLSGALFLLAAREIARQLHGVHYHELLAAISAISPGRLAAAAACAALSYFALTLYDTLGLRYCGRALPYRKTAFASFASSALNNNAGMSGLAGASLRYRLYSAWGIPVREIAAVIAFSGVTVWLGFAALAGVSFTLAPPHVRQLALPRAAGLLLLLVPIAYLGMLFLRRRPLVLGRWSFTLPRPVIGAAQVAVAVVDWTAVAAALHLLLPQSTAATWAATLSAFLLAQFAGMASNLPGGVGVFDAVMLALLAGHHAPGPFVAALVAFRATYYFAPLAAAAVMIAMREAVAGRRFFADAGTRIVRAGGGFVRAGAMFVRGIFSVGVFLEGGTLLLSGATPAERVRMEALRLAVPLPLLELSHIGSMLCGASLLLLARGVQRRLDGAYWLALTLSVAGIVFSLLKGLDYEEAALLALLVAALLPFRGRFYRRTRLVNEPFSASWLVAIALTLLSIFWIGLFAFRRVEYSHDLWWHFSYHAGDAARFLRSGVAAAALVVLFAARRLLAAGRSRADGASSAMLDDAARIAERAPSSAAPLVLLGDKQLLFNEQRTAFVMYRTQGRSWIAMGDPVGPPPDASELAWRFVEEVDRHDGWPVFYQVRREYLSLYADMGLMLSKLGEEAWIDLPSFTLSGNDRKSLRHTWRKLTESGLTFEVVPREEVPPLLGELRAVSTAWLSTRNAREKGFSLGSFTDDYLSRFRMAVVREAGRIVAFANVWEIGAAGELSVDLMRYVPEAPAGVMDFLFIGLMTFGRDEGWRRFNLGMAPLAGVHRRSGAALWPRVAAFGFEHGNRFSNFQGLRQFKAKFGPQWEPVYLASPGGLKLASIFADLAVLIGGGVRGVIAR